MRMLGSYGGSRGFGRGGIYIPPKPTIVSVEDVGAARPYDNGALSVTVSPDPLGPIPDFYNAWAVDPQGNEYLGSGSTSNTTFTIPYLKTGVAYTVKVVAVVNFVASEFATSTTPVTITTVPQAPTIGTASDVGIGRSLGDAAALVTFTPGLSGGKDQSYRVYTTDGTERGFDFSSPILAAGIDIEYDNTHSFRVTSVNANGESLPSGNTEEITLTSTPGGPSLIINSVSNNEINFTYSVPNTGGKPVTSVRVYVMSDGNEIGSSTFSASSGTTSLTVTGNPGTSAYLWGQATNENGDGNFGIAGTPMTRSEIATLSASRTGSSTATVTITNYNSAYSYYVTTSSGTASRSAGTISITGASSEAFTVTVVTDGNGEFELNSTASTTVPVYEGSGGGGGTTWYGSACCDGSVIISDSNASEAAVIDNLDFMCANGTLTNVTTSTSGYPSITCDPISPFFPPAFGTTWYGTACCDGQIITSDSNASEAAVIDNLEAMCIFGTLTNLTTSTSGYPSVTCDPLPPFFPPAFGYSIDPRYLENSTKLWDKYVED